MWVFSWPGIHSVQFDGQCQHIVAMCSLEGEVVPLRNLVRISNNVEVIFTIPCVVCGVVAWIVWEVKHLFVVLVLIVCTVCVCVCAKVWLSELSAEMKETLKQSEELLNVSTVEINFSWPKRCFDISQRRGRGGDYQDS